MAQVRPGVKQYQMAAWRGLSGSLTPGMMRALASGNTTTDTERANAMATWEMVLIGIIAAAVTMWFLPGIRAQMERQKHKEQEEGEQPKDWRGLILPLVFVSLFVLLLISLI